jgi:NAD(P)-dependent dehydrogenase (short-subunit alcohol dehydrogenase family)
MLLNAKHAVIYGGSGSIGGAVARAFAAEGAVVHAPSHAEVDALDEAAVDAHAASLPRIDISFNAIQIGDVQGTPMAEMAVDDYVDPLARQVRTQFLTTRAAVRRMREHGEGGVLLFFGGTGDPPRGFALGMLQAGFHAVEHMRRQLAVELGPDRIRTVTLRTGGIPESLPDGMEGAEAIAESLASATLSGRCATLEDVGRVAAFVASDGGRTMTGATVNVSSGALLD